MMMETLPPSTATSQSLVGHVGVVVESSSPSSSSASTASSSSPTSPSSSSSSSTLSSASASPQSGSSSTSDSPLPVSSSSNNNTNLNGNSNLMNSIASVSFTSSGITAAPVASVTTTTILTTAQSTIPSHTGLSVAPSPLLDSSSSNHQMAPNTQVMIGTQDSNKIKSSALLVTTNAITTNSDSIPTTTFDSKDLETKTTTAINSNGQAKTVATISSFVLPISLNDSAGPGTISTTTSGGNNPNRLIPASSVVAAIQSSKSHTSVTSNMNGSITSNNIMTSTGKKPSGSEPVTIQQMAAAVASTTPTALPSATITSQQAQKRPMNAFLIFCKRHRSVVRDRYPHLENRSITKILGEWWAALNAEEKHDYTDLARQYKEAFMKANPHFKWYKTTEPPRPPPPPSSSSTNSGNLTTGVGQNTHMMPSNLPATTVQNHAYNTNNNITVNTVILTNNTGSNKQSTMANNNTTTTTEVTVASNTVLTTTATAIPTTNISHNNSVQSSNSSNNTSVGVGNLSMTSANIVSPSAISNTNNNNANNNNNNNNNNKSVTTTLNSNVNINSNSGGASTSSGGTPKPPKKRYLESMESNGDFTKKIITATNVSGMNGTCSTLVVNQNISATNNSIQSYQSGIGAINGGSTANNNSKLIHPPLEKETASRVIEQQLFGFRKVATPEISSENSSQSKFDTPGNSSSELKAAKTMLAIASAASGVGSSALDITNSNSCNSESSLSAGGSHHSDSGSETASDDEAPKTSQTSPPATTNTGGLFYQENVSKSSPPSSIKNDDEDKPLNLSSTPTVRTITRSQQQIIEHYIDKFLSAGQRCDFKPMPPELQANLNNGVLNLTTPTTTTQNSIPTLSSNPKFFMVPKETSVRSIANTNANSNQSVQSTITTNNKRPHSDVLNNNGSPGKTAISMNSANNSKIAPMISMNNPTGNASTEPSPNKRSRINGAVIGVNEMMAAMAMASGTNNNENTNNSNTVENPHSKFVTGSFDLEEHIRQLPQLDNNHLVNALHLRNQHDLTKSSSASTNNSHSTSSTSTVAHNPTLMIVTAGSGTTTGSVVRNSATTSTASSLVKTVLYPTSAAMTNPTTNTQTTSQSQHSFAPLSSSQQPENLKLTKPSIIGSTAGKIPVAVTTTPLTLPATQLLSNRVPISTSSELNMDALPLRLVAASAGALPGSGVPTSTNAVSPRMPLTSSSVVIKLGTGQTIPVQSFEGANLVPFLIRGNPSGSGSVSQPIIMTAPMATTHSQTNKPMDLSVAIPSSAANSPLTTVTESLNTGTALHHLAAAVRTTPSVSVATGSALSSLSSTFSPPQPQAYLATSSTTPVNGTSLSAAASVITSSAMAPAPQPQLLFPISPQSTISLPAQAPSTANSSNNASSSVVPSSLSSSAMTSSSLTTATPSPVSSGASPSSSSSSGSPNLLSTVISSQGSINQCDGLAALAEIALQQANR